MSTLPNLSPVKPAVAHDPPGDLMTTIPADPVVLEQLPPDDFNACEHCRGRGVVLLTRDDTDPAAEVDTDCRWCDGTGDRRITANPPTIRCRRLRVSPAALSELLARRPDLDGLTSVSFVHALQVSAA